VGTFRSSDLCIAIGIPAGQGFDTWWTEEQLEKDDFLDCPSAMDWAAIPMNAARAEYGWDALAAPPQKLGDSQYRVETKLAIRDGRTILTKPLWPNMTGYQKAALTELMNRFYIHERGHLRIHAEVARVQTGKRVITGDEKAAIEWSKQWALDSRDLVKSAQKSYEDVVNGGTTQAAMGGKNTVLQVCNPKAAVLGDVPAGDVGKTYSARLEFGKASTDDPDLVIKHPVTWTILEGNLPPGLRLNEYGGGRGGIVGEPTEKGEFTFTIQAKDANDLTATREISIIVTGETTITLQQQYYSVAGRVRIQANNPEHEQGCRRIGRGIEADEVTGWALPISYETSSTESQDACARLTESPVPAPGVPFTFADSVAVSFAAGDCERSGSGQLAAVIQPDSSARGFEIQTSGAVEVLATAMGGCHVLDQNASSSTKHVLKLSGGSADFQWQITECAEQNLSSVHRALTLYKRTEPSNTLVIRQECGNTGTPDPGTVVLEPGVYELTTSIGYSFLEPPFRYASPGGTASIGTTVRISPTPEPRS
jgi:Putative Ig domain